jgi:hypothetical protein
MLLGEILFVLLAATLIVMLTLGIFVATNIRKSKKETPIIEEIERNSKSSIEKTVKKQLINVSNVDNVPKSIIVDLPESIEILNKVEFEKSNDLSDANNIPQQIDYRKELEKDYYGLKAEYQKTNTPFFDSVDDDKYSTDLVEASNLEEGIHRGISNCPHCNSDVPSTLYCIYCGQSLIQTQKVEATKNTFI